MTSAEAIAEQVRCLVLAPGEYAIVEMTGTLTAEDMDLLADLVPEDLRGRLLFVDGKVHTLKPEETA